MAKPIEADPVLEVCGHRFAGPFCRPDRLPAASGEFLAVDVRASEFVILAVGFHSNLRDFVADPAKHEDWAKECQGCLMFAFYSPREPTEGERDLSVNILDDLDAKLGRQR